jgi:replication factor C subunit 2/4
MEEVKNTQPFVEKYRPQKIDDIVGDKAIIKFLSEIRDNGNVPHMIMSGPPGTGKTTSIHCLARELLGNDYDKAVLEINASNERGIDVVRNKVKMFAKKKLVLPANKHKIIILDEVDCMTSAAQQALRRTIEIYANTTRFALACNNSKKIIEAIQSRCTMLRYPKLQDDQIVNRLKEITGLEGIKADDEGINAIVFMANGDMRNALNTLQAVHARYRIVDEQNVYEICDNPCSNEMTRVINACIDKDVEGAYEYMNQMILDGYTINDIIDTFSSSIKKYDMDPELKLRFMMEIGSIHVRIVMGLATKTQMVSLLARLCKL